jgi:hypothetical protein
MAALSLVSCSSTVVCPSLRRVTFSHCDAPPGLRHRLATLAVRFAETNLWWLYDDSSQSTVECESKSVNWRGGYVYTRGMVMSIVVAEMLVPLSRATPFEHGTNGRMAHPEDKKHGASVDDASRQTQPKPCAETHRTSVSAQLKPCIAAKRWIPLDLVQNAAEYLGRVPSLLSFRGVSTGWQGAVSDAVGFLNGRRWTRLKLKLQCGENGPLWASLKVDSATMVVRCALLCLAHRLETLEWWYPDDLDFVLRLLGENNTVLTTLYLNAGASSKRTTDASCCELRSCCALKKLVLTYSSVTDAGVRGLELIPALEELNLYRCYQITNVGFLQNCRALKKLDLSYTNVTDAGIRGLKLIPTLEDLDHTGCEFVHDLRALQHRPLLRLTGPLRTLKTTR